MLIFQKYFIFPVFWDDFNVCLSSDHHFHSMKHFYSFIPACSWTLLLRLTLRGNVRARVCWVMSKFITTNRTRALSSTSSRALAGPLGRVMLVYCSASLFHPSSLTFVLPAILRPLTAMKTDAAARARGGAPPRAQGSADARAPAVFNLCTRVFCLCELEGKSTQRGTQMMTNRQLVQEHIHLESEGIFDSRLFSFCISVFMFINN